MGLGRRVVPVLLLCLPLSGCAASHPAARGDPVSTAASQGAPDYDSQERANRDKAETGARQLLTLVGLPPGAVELTAAPAALTGPALGSTRSATEVDLARYWHLPLPFAAADAYLRQHPPAGLSEWGSSSGGSSGAKGYAWADSSGGQLQLGLAPAGGSASYLRADAVATWLDPHPLRDAAPGPRLRIEAGGRCPASTPPWCRRAGRAAGWCAPTRAATAGGSACCGNGRSRPARPASLPTPPGR
jgi:hypothetical protein